MKYLSIATIIVTICFEIVLLYYYFFVLLPSYNKIGYNKPELEDGASPTCSLFITQSEAQEFYILYKESIENAEQLDNDDDGKVCENLP